MLKARLTQRSERAIVLVMGFPAVFWRGYLLAAADECDF